MALKIAPAADLVSLIQHLDDFGDAPALRWFAATGEQALSYAQLAQRVEHAAAALQETGLRAGERVLLLAESGLPWALAALAVLRAGGVLLPLDVHSTDEVLHHVLDDARVRCAITDVDTAPRLHGSGLPVLLAPDLADANGATRTRAVAVDPASTAVMFYTSGTTGAPKGVPLSHANLLYQLRTVAGLDLARIGDRVLLPLPMHHVYPLVIGLLLPLCAGLVLLLPGATGGAQIMHALREGQASVLIGVPRLYRALLEGIDARIAGLSPPRRRLLGGLRSLARLAAPRLGSGFARRVLTPLHRQLAPQLRLLACGGAALEAELDDALSALGWQVAVGYGLTETSPLLTLRLHDDGGSGTAGRPVPGTELRLGAPPPGEDQAQAGAGEIEVRGGGVFAGYFDLPQANKDAFTPDGWFRTGDLGRLDSDGCLEVLGRASTLIVTESGKNIQPEEVEAVYQAHPLIAEAAVLQIDRRLVALLVAQPGAGAAADDAGTDVRQALSEQSQRLPSYQRVVEFAVTEHLLERTALGKLRRHLLAERYREARAAQQRPGADARLSVADEAQLADPRARAVWDFLRERYADRPLTPDSHVQLDLGLDSLGWLNFGLDIASRSGVQLSEEAIARIATVRDLLREVSVADSALPQTLLQHPESVLDPAQRRWLAPPPAWTLPLRWLLLGFNLLLMRGAFRLRVRGAQHLPARGAYLLAPNHSSYLDAPALGAALGRRSLRQLCWAGWAGIMLASRPMRVISRLARVLPMDSERRALSSLAFGLAALRAGNALVWFPEGARSRSGALEPFLPGIGLLLEHTDVPVLPVYIEGADQAWPVARRWPRARPITVHIGAPLSAAGLLAEPGPGQPHERAARALHQAVAELIHARRADPPAS